MFNLFKKSSIVLGVLIFISCGGGKNTDAKPSIKDNSNHFQKVEAVDYSGTPSSKLLLQVQAHYNLEEYTVAKDKLVFLMKSHTDTLDGIDLKTLKSKIDTELLAIQKKKQAAFDLEQNKRLQGSLNNMRTETIGENTFFYDKSSPEFDTKECFYAYVKKDIYGYKLFLKARYIDIEWLNIESYIINVDKLDYTITGEVVKSETKGKKRYNIELLDKELTNNKDIDVLNAISNGNQVSVLYVGPSSYKTRAISDRQKLAIRNVLDAYMYLNQTNNK